ncbi:MAG: hypothetical protein ACYC46_12540 [Acidobacteriaceae bacterium]
MLVRGKYNGAFGGYEMTCDIYKHQCGEISLNVVARLGASGTMKSYWVRRGEFLNPAEKTAYAIVEEPLKLRIGKAKNVTDAEKRAILKAIGEWEGGIGCAATRKN